MIRHAGVIRGGALVLAMVVAIAGGDCADARAVPAPAACSALAGHTFAPAAIGLPTGGVRIDSARMLPVVADQPGAGEVCVVMGAIRPVDPAAPDIRFQLNLPSAWNGKAAQFGGGGFDGTVVTGRNPDFIPPEQEPVRRGYATFGSDSGHQAGDGDALKGAVDGHFALNGEALRNYAGDQIKKTHDAAMAIIAVYYGRTPGHTYFYGGSQGGHEALLAIQRWPRDYAGAVAIHPAYNYSTLMLAWIALSRDLYGTPGAWFSPAQARMLGEAVVARCDALDGLVDGVVGNVAACHRVFDPASLACRGGRMPPACLTDRQLAAVERIAAPRRIAGVHGPTTFPGWPILDGALATPSWEGYGQRADPSSPPTDEDGFGFHLADQIARYFLKQGASTDVMTLDPRKAAAAIRAYAAMADLKGADFDRFHARGGKLLLIHGSIDLAIPPANSVALYDRLKRRYGAGTADFARFYIVPGFGHGGGAFPMEWDSLAALDNWVETGHAPAHRIARSGGGSRPGSRRPVCEYPAWPRYRGTGDAGAANNFACE